MQWTVIYLSIYALMSVLRVLEWCAEYRVNVYVISNSFHMRNAFTATGPGFFHLILIPLQAESPEGRLWILQQAAFDDALPILGVLTVDPHQWAASNSALVLAR